MVVGANHPKNLIHRVMSTTTFAFSPEFLIISSRQPTSCLTRLATIISYSFTAADENARFHGLRCSMCNLGLFKAINIVGFSLQPDYYRFQMDNIRDTIYARGPLDRPPFPRTGCIREESRIESSFGPIKLSEQSYIRLDSKRWDHTTVILTYSYHVPKAFMKALVVPMYVARCAVI